jgi:ribosomal protein L18
MEEELLSLYDYLGKAAGSELGKQVNEVAKTKKIKYVVKEVSTPTYKGKVMMYPKSFLDNYFKENVRIVSI